MAKRPRLCPIGIPQHIIQRGNNPQACFACDGDLPAGLIY
jgi:putative transposase